MKLKHLRKNTLSELLAFDLVIFFLHFQKLFQVINFGIFLSNLADQVLLLRGQITYRFWVFLS